jgi:hypothetical protein
MAQVSGQSCGQVARMVVVILRKAVLLFLKE